MNQIKLKKSIGLAFLLFAISFSGIAQPHHQQVKKKEMRAFLKNEVMPVMKDARKAFDAKLSAKEQKEIAQYRQELEALKAKGKKLRAELPAKHSENFELPSSAQRQAMRELEKSKREIMQGVWEIADRHEQDLDQVLVSLEPKLKEWHEKMMEEDGRRTGAQQIKGTPATESKGKKKGQKPNKKAKHMRPHHGGPMGMLNNGAKFLLMDPDHMKEAPMPPMEMDEE